MIDLAFVLSLVPLAFVQISAAIFATSKARMIEFGPSGPMQLYCCGALTIALAIYLARNPHHDDLGVGAIVMLVSFIWTLNVLSKSKDITPPPWKRKA